MFKLNVNSFGIDAVNTQAFKDTVVQPGEEKDLELLCIPNTLANYGGNPPQKPPILLQVGFACNLDKVYFEVPVLAQMLFMGQPSQEGQGFISSWVSNQLEIKPHWECTIPKMSS